MMFDKIVEIGLLYDFYGKLLNKNQNTVIELYYIYDFSLSEIGEQLNISRQGVYDILKRSELKLYRYEETLGLIKRFRIGNKKIEEILNYIKEIKQEADLYDCKNIYNNAEKIERLALGILDVNQEVKE